MNIPKLQSAKIKSMNDFIAGLGLVCFGIFLIVSKTIIEGKEPSDISSYMSATTYLRVLGFLIVLLASIMTLQAVNFKKETETAAFGLEFKLESILTIIAVLLYILVLRRIGFLITSFVFTLFLVCLYMRKENAGEKLTRQEIIKKLASAFVFSLVLVVSVYLIFTKLMLATLP